MSSTTLGAAIGTAAPLLSAWLGNEVPPTAELSHEAFQAIARCAQVICAWRAEETQWSTVRAIALDECTRLEAMSGAHSSSLAPQHANAMFGDFRNWPLYSSLVAGAANPTDSTWSFVASLVAWPSLGPNVAGIAPQAGFACHDAPHLGRCRLLAAASAAAVSKQIAEGARRQVVGRRESPCERLPQVLPRDPLEPHPDFLGRREPSAACGDHQEDHRPFRVFETGARRARSR
jgi:hypothetical protein